MLSDPDPILPANLPPVFRRRVPQAAQQLLPHELSRRILSHVTLKHATTIGLAKAIAAKTAVAEERCGFTGRQSCDWSGGTSDQSGHSL